MNIYTINQLLEEFDKLKKQNEKLKAELELYRGTLHNNHILVHKINDAIDYLNTATITPENILHYRQCLLDILEGGDNK